MTTHRYLIALFAGTLIFVSCTTKPAKESVEEPAKEPAKKVAPLSPQQVVVAALAGEIEVVGNALEQGYEVDLPDAERRTVLMYAAFNGQTEIAKKLIAAGADVNIQDQTGSTALMFAASGPFPETAKLLLESGAEINTIDSNEHFTALMWAAAEGQAETVKLLLTYGADVTLMDVDGDTAESFAAQKGHTAVVNILQAATLKSPKSEETKTKTP